MTRDRKTWVERLTLAVGVILITAIGAVALFGSSRVLQSKGTPVPTQKSLMQAGLSPAESVTYQQTIRDDNRQADDRRRTVLVALAAALSVLAGAFAAYRNAKAAQGNLQAVLDGQLTAAKQLDLAIRQSTSERFRVGVEQLSAQSVSTRLGGIYSLAALQVDEPVMRQQIHDILCAYVRDRTRDKDAEDDSASSLDLIAVVDHLLSQAVDSRRPIDFSGANLTAFDFSKRSLRSANLDRAILAATNLTDCDLSGASLQNACLYGATVSGANFSNANLSSSDLQALNFVGPFARASFANANLYGCYMAYSDLVGSDFTGSDLYGSFLLGASLAFSTMTDANLTSAYFAGSDIRGVDFTKARLGGATFLNANLRGSDFSDAQLEACDICEADLSEAKIKAIQLDRAIYSSGTVFPLDFGDPIGLVKMAVDPSDHSTLVQRDVLPLGFLRDVKLPSAILALANKTLRKSFMDRRANATALASSIKAVWPDIDDAPAVLLDQSKALVDDKIGDRGSDGKLSVRKDQIIPIYQGYRAVASKSIEEFQALLKVPQEVPRITPLTSLASGSQALRPKRRPFRPKKP